ncbi:hypothetical protein AOQ84DRAFT_353578 [Glonium stellatum]|uniref:Uncharacterized protein n=1 Tax=Glonium stellatum TaxID=574774 RepID=A0A8E2JUW0_9PEZI|nr:hypothetical protein AOQ84DRAFT_353578 [Glonium stellatum]
MSANSIYQRSSSLIDYINIKSPNRMRPRHKTSQFLRNGHANSFRKTSLLHHLLHL